MEEWNKVRKLDRQLPRRADLDAENNLKPLDWLVPALVKCLASDYIIILRLPLCDLSQDSHVTQLVKDVKWQCLDNFDQQSLRRRLFHLLKIEIVSKRPVLSYPCGQFLLIFVSL